MHGAFGFPEVSFRDRQTWLEKLLNSDSQATCVSKECRQWDRHYNTSDDPILNERRRNDQVNYPKWIKTFCESIGPEEHSALQKLELDHGCMPCIGRMLYQALKLEYMSSYFMPQHDFEHLKNSAAFPDNLSMPRTRLERWRRNAVRNWMARTLVEAVVDHCGRPHFEDICILLNLGTHIRTELRDGVFSAYCFPLLADDDVFMPGKLIMRARRGNPLLAFCLVIADFSWSKMLDLPRYLRSKNYS